MNNWWTPLPALLSLIGSCLGALLGFWLFRIGQYTNFVTAVVTMSVLGASAGFVVGTSLRQWTVDAALNGYFGVALSLLMLCGAIFLVLVGVATHASSLEYNGLIFAVASILPLVRNSSSTATALSFAGIAALAFWAFTASGDRSWLIIGIPSALAALLTYINGHYHRLAS